MKKSQLNHRLFLTFICFTLLFIVELHAVKWSDDSQFAGRIHPDTVDGRLVEIIDVNVFLYRDWADLEESGDDTLYLQALEYWADGLYEMTNGANYLGTVTIYTGETSCASEPCFQWKASASNPSAALGGYWSSKPMIMADSFSYEGYALESPMKNGAVLTHESMHWIYGLKDEYGNGAIGNPNTMYIEDKGLKCKVHEQPGSNELVIRRTYQKVQDYDVLFCLEAYHVGTHFQFSSISEIDKTRRYDLPPGIKEGRDDPFAIYVIDSIALQDTIIHGIQYHKSASLFISELDGTPVVFGEDSTKDIRYHLKHPGRYYWGSQHSIGVGQGQSAYLTTEQVDGIPYRIPLKDPQYQWLNFGTHFVANPHNVQGRAWRTQQNEYLGQWRILTDSGLYVYDPSGATNQTAGQPVEVLLRSLQGRQPTINDTTFTKSVLFDYTDSTCTYDSTKMLGELYSGAGRSQNYVDRWKDCHKYKAEESDYQPVAIPYMKVELNDPIHRARARQYLQTRWVNLRHNIAVVIDFSGSMLREDKIIKAKEKAKQVVETAYLAHDSSMTVSIIAFSDSVLKVIETDHDNYQQKLQELDDYAPHMGQTAIYSAIDKAIHIIQEKDADSTSRKAVFLISDGKDNATNPKVANLFEMKIKLNQIGMRRWKIPIHTFPFGTDADTAFLAGISRLTDGDFWGANVEEPSNLNMAFSGSMSGSSNIETQLTFYLQNGESAPLVISPGTRSIMVYGNHDPATSGNLIFTTPSGNIHTVVPDKLCLEDRCYLTWRFYPASDSLDTGLWNMTARGTQIDGTVLEIGDGAVKYTLKAEVDPDNIITAPQPIVLTARLKGPVWSVTRYHSQAILTYPDGSKREIPMNDEGLEGDETAGDGLYTYTLRDYSQEGHYQLYFEANNTDSSATFTAVGISIQGSMPAFEPLSDQIIRSSRVDFMVDSVAVDDHLSPPEVLTALYQGGDKVFGRIDFAGDEDWFVVEDLDLYKDLGLALYTPDDSATYTLELYYPMDINKPLITKSWSAWDEKQLYIPASRLMTGMRIRLRCDQPFSTYEIIAYKSSRAFLEVGRFEEEEDWSASSGAMELRSAGRFEGDKSLFITSDGWREITSRKVHTQDITQVSNRLSMRVYIPANPVNPYWIGTVSLKVNIPSAAKSWDLGEHTLNNTVRNMWNLFHWSVPADLKAALAEPHPDVQFVITLNGNAPLGLDYLHFSGDLEENWVDAYEIVCPEPGCSPETAIDLGPANSTKRFVAYGNIWLKISQFPTDWSPSHLHFGIASEDGQPITGEVEYMGQIYDLEQWYQQFDEEYLFTEPLLIRLNNVSGRPYRIHWWADGYREVYSSDWRLQPLGMRSRE